MIIKRCRELALVAAVPRQTEVNRESSLQTLVE